MRRPIASAFWIGTLGALGIFDLWCAKNKVDGDSLSEVARATLCTHHPIGRAVFIGSWAALSAWIVPHICRAIQIESAPMGDPRDAPTSGGPTTT